MTDMLTRHDRSVLMGRIRSRDTRPELFIRRSLHAMGYRYRTHVRGLPGRPDLVFTKRHSVIFVHGCFWHRHGCANTYTPKTREEFWQRKFAGNVRRDRRDQSLLAQAGWRILVVWECEIRRDETILDRTTTFLGSPRISGED